MALTNVAIRNAKPKKNQYKLADSNGLYVLIKPNGTKYWRLKYRYGGKEKLLSFGIYPDVSLVEARQERDNAKKLLREGKDPGQQRKQQKQMIENGLSNTFEIVTYEWIEKQKNRWTERHSNNVLQSLSNNIFPTLGARPINEITTPEFLNLMRKIEKRGVLETAARVLQRCSMIFRYGIVTGRCERNPAADLKGALESPKKKNYASLAASELPQFLRKLENYDGQLQTKLALKLLILTFVRTTELRGAEWSEFNMEEAEWRIPAERMKMKEEHIVPLSEQAIEILEQLRPLTGSGKYVFPNQANSNKFMSENTMLYALYRLGYHSRATGHGFRSTASTILNEMGFHADAIERQLAHSERNKIRATYNKAKYLPERQKIMQHWADYLGGLSTGAKILPLKTAL